MNKPIIVFDVETTGTDVCRDRIVELYACKILPPAKEVKEELHLFFNPGFPMSEEVIAVHGITDEQVANCPAFADKANAVFSFFDGCMLAGHNITKFDVLILAEEFNRAGYAWDVKFADILDTYAIEKAMHSHSLIASYKRYYGVDYDTVYGKAHGAKADTLANVDVMLAQLNELGIAFEDAELPKYQAVGGDNSNKVDLAGMLIRNDNGEVCYNFGKHKGQPVLQQRGYANWMLCENFHSSTKAVLRKLLGLS